MDIHDKAFEVGNGTTTHACIYIYIVWTDGFTTCKGPWTEYANIQNYLAVNFNLTPQRKNIVLITMHAWWWLYHIPTPKQLPAGGATASALHPGLSMKMHGMRLSPWSLPPRRQQVHWQPWNEMNINRNLTKKNILCKIEDHRLTGHGEDEPRINAS